MPRCVCQAGSDLLYIMGYDTRAQIFGRCIASANSPPAGEPSASFRPRNVGWKRQTPSAC